MKPIFLLPAARLASIVDPFWREARQTSGAEQHNEVHHDTVLLNEEAVCHAPPRP